MYEKFYGLSENPFRLSPDPALIYKSRGHGHAYAYLRYGTYMREGFILMTGEIGAGKTTLARLLLSELDRNCTVAAQIVSTQLDAENLLRSIAFGFGLSVEDASKAALLERFESFLRLLARHDRHALLIIDEAQNLTPDAMEELRMLSNFQFGIRPTLQSFLVGQPGLRDLMRVPSMQALRDRIIGACHLSGLKPDETRAYVLHRLRKVGWKGDPAFDSRIFEFVHQSSDGIPRRINSLCSRILLSGYLSQSHRIELEQVSAAAAELQAEIGGHVARCQRPLTVN
jgi:general secretion pathway protein A